MLLAIQFMSWAHKFDLSIFICINVRKIHHKSSSVICPCRNRWIINGWVHPLHTKIYPFTSVNHTLAISITYQQHGPFVPKQAQLLIWTKIKKNKKKPRKNKLNKNCKLWPLGVVILSWVAPPHPHHLFVRVF